MGYQFENLPLISVIAPVFNTDAVRLSACVESILNQSSPAFEIIIIDDGSTEVDCLDYLDRVEQQHSIIKVIHMSHRGVSAARNTGVEHASGDYVLFVDSDDRLPPHMLEKGRRAVVESRCDVVLGYVQYVAGKSFPAEHPGDGPSFSRCSVKELLSYHVKGSSSSLKTTLGKDSFLKIGPVARLVKTDLAKSISFPEDVSISEDTLWSIELFLKAKSAAIVEDIWYWYYKGGQSASSGVHPPAANNTRDCLDALKRIVDGNEDAISKDEVIARVLGEVSRVARLWYSTPECNLKYRECVREMNTLLDGTGFDYIDLPHAAAGGLVLAIKYLMCRTGLFIFYWRFVNWRNSR